MDKIKIYNLRIVPPDPIFEEIVQLKKQFVTVFGKQPLSQSKPHVTLAAFKMYTHDEDKMLKAFNQLSAIAKFRVDIQGFSIFENNANVLSLKIPMTEEINQIHTRVKILWIRDLHRKPASIKISKTPHITISKTDGNKMLCESLTYFNKIEYSKQMEVNSLTMVSRNQNKTWDWEHQIYLEDSTN
ncbi:MAG: 2'-5' RNA ligase family protein [Leeuwenhoekiella sp.]